MAPAPLTVPAGADDRRAGTGWLIVFTLAALSLRLWGLTFGLPHTLARPDENVVIERAIRMWSDGPNPHAFDWPTLYIYLMAAAVRLDLAVGHFTGRVAADADVVRAATEHQAQLYVITRVIAALLGTATVPALYWAARRRFSRAIALLAALFLSVAFLHVRDSHFGVTDVPATLLVVVAFGLAVGRPVDATHPWNALAAALVCGLAASTKYNAAIVAVPLLVEGVRQEWRASLDARRVAALVALISVGVGLGFVIGTPYAVLDSREFLAGILDQSAHLASGHGITLGRGWWRHVTISFRYGIGWPMLLSALAGAVLLAVRPRYLSGSFRAGPPRTERHGPMTDADRPVIARPANGAAGVLAFPLVYYAAIGSGRTVFVRYVLPMVPFMCLLAAVAVTWIARTIRAYGASRAVEFLATSVIAGGIVLPNVARSVAFDRLISVLDNRVVAARWLEATFPSGASVYQTGQPYAQVQLPGRFRKWEYDPTADVRQIRSADLPRLVIVPTSRLTLYVGVSDLAAGVIRARYRSLISFPVERPARTERLVYDEQDAFFVPLSGFGRLDRPGPALEVLELKTN